jgi:hypothetical protein
MMALSAASDWEKHRLSQTHCEANKDGWALLAAIYLVAANTDNT